jgi:hypothetical protein
MKKNYTWMKWGDDCGMYNGFEDVVNLLAERVIARMIA